MSTPDKNAMLERVRALLAKAEATEFEAEAEALTAKATELMAKYGIDKAMAEARAHVTPKPVNKVFTIDQPYSQVKGHLLHAVARALHCKGVTLRTSGPTSRVHVFGFESDVELVEMLYTSLLLQMSHATARHPIPGWLRGREVMAERRSFMLGFVGGVSPRLETAYALAEEEADDTGTPGTALVLRNRDAAVEDALGAVYPKLTKTRITWRGGGYGAGHEAGQRANIHDRPNVGAGAGRELSR